MVALHDVDRSRKPSPSAVGREVQVVGVGPHDH
jgi:hypothetical protein